MRSRTRRRDPGTTTNTSADDSSRDSISTKNSSPTNSSTNHSSTVAQRRLAQLVDEIAATHGDRPPADRPGPERAGRERPGQERPGQERPGRERPGRERAGPEQLHPDRPEPPRPHPERPDNLGPGSGADPSGGPPAGKHRAEPLAPGRRLSATIGDRLPATAQRLGAEGGVSGQHVTVVALVVAALVAVGAWWVLAGRPGEPTAVAPVVSSPASAADVPATPPSPTAGIGSTAGVPGEPGAASATTGAPASGQQVVIDVTGKVRRPGLVVLPAGSRVADALDSAGGVRTGVDTDALNLARPLVDGEQILVGVEAATLSVPTAPGATAPGATAPPVGALVNVNTATLEQLDTLPGIGPVTGQAILDWRATNGQFTSVDELLEVDGIGDVTLADIRELVTV